MVRVEWDSAITDLLGIFRKFYSARTTDIK